MKAGRIDLLPGFFVLFAVVLRLRQRSRVATIFGRIANLVWFLFTWFLLVGVVCAALIGFHFYGRVDEQLRTHVEDLLADQYPGLDVSVKYARLIEREGFRIGGVSFSESSNEGASRELAYIDEILVRCKPTLDDLLRGHVEVAEVIVRHAAVRSIRNPDGSWSVRHFAKIPQFGGRSLPKVFVDDATLEIYDPSRRPTGMYTLRDIQVQVRPELVSRDSSSSSELQLQVEGSFTGDHLQRTIVQAAVNPDTNAWRLVGQVAGLSVSPSLTASLPTEVADQLELLGELQAHCAFTFDVTSDGANAISSGATTMAATTENNTPAIQYEIAGSMIDGRLTEPALSLPLTDISATFACNNESLRITDVTGRFGEAVAHMSCRRDGMQAENPFVIQGNVENLRLDRALVANLPESWRNAWDKFRPEGQASAEFELVRDFGVWASDVRIQCHDVGFTWDKFPYRVESTQGTVRIRPEQVSFDLVADSDRQPLHLRGEVAQPGDHWHGWFEARADQPMAIDEQFISATSPKTQEIIRSFAAHGNMTFLLRVSREQGKLEPDNYLDFNFVDGNIRHKSFPYPLHSVRAKIERRNNLWTFRDIVGENDSGKITCEGNYDGAGDGGILRLRFIGTEMPLEEELRAALPAGIQNAWRSLQPQGTLDHVAADFTYNSASQRKNLVVTLQEGDAAAGDRTNSLSIRPERFPFRIDQLQGVATYENGQVRFRDIQGRHQDIDVTAKGNATIGDDQSWSLTFEKFAVDRLQANSELLRALPPALRDMLTSLQLEGTVWLDGALRLAGQQNDPRSLSADWRLLVDMEDASMWLGTQLDHVFGQVTLRGNSHAAQFGCRGELDIDSLMAKGVQLTSVQGPIWIDPQRLVAGTWAGSPAPGMEPRPIESMVFGGQSQTDFQILYDDLGRFDLRFRLFDAALTEFERAQRKRTKVAARGRAWADIQLTGNKLGRHNLRGNGSAQLRDTNFYELPFFLSLFKTMRTGSTDRTAFTSSDAKFRLQGDHIYFDSLDLNGDALTMKGVGEMNLNRDLKLDFYTVVGREDAYLPAIRPLLGMASRRFLVVKVAGSVDNPQMSREVLPDLNDTLRQLFPEVEPASSAAAVAKIDSSAPVGNAIQRTSGP